MIRHTYTGRVTAGALESAVERLRMAAQLEAQGHHARAAELAAVAVSDLFGDALGAAALEEVSRERAA